MLAGLVIVGGLKRIASVTERLVPFMAVIYVIGALIIVVLNADKIGPVFVSIIKGAFGMKAVGGGIVGSGVAYAVQWGMKRGVFSNEAGLGSSVMVHSSSNVREPVVQGIPGSSATEGSSYPHWAPLPVHPPVLLSSEDKAGIR